MNVSYKKSVHLKFGPLCNILPVDICETPHSQLPCVSIDGGHMNFSRTSPSRLTEVLGTCEHISPELRPISSIYCCRSNICLIGQISHNRSNIWKIIKIFSNVWESFQIMLFFLVVMGPQIILLLISTLQQPKLAGKGRQKSWKRRSANVSQSLKRSLLSNFMYVG